MILEIPDSRDLSQAEQFKTVFNKFVKKYRINTRSVTLTFYDGSKFLI